MTGKRRRYRCWSVRAWGDATIRSISWPEPNALTLYQYLVLGPEGRFPGLVHAGLNQIAEALSWDQTPRQNKRFLIAFDELLEKKLVVFDRHARLFYIPNSLNHEPPANFKQPKNWLFHFHELPDSPLKSLWVNELREVVNARGGDSRDKILEVFEDTVTDTVNDTESDTGNHALTLTQAGTHTVSPQTPQKGDSFSQGFEEFWKTYRTACHPDPVGSKTNAEKKWSSLKPDVDLQKEIAGGVQRWQAAREAANANGGFFQQFPHAERFLKDRRFEDEFGDPAPSCDSPEYRKVVAWYRQEKKAHPIDALDALKAKHPGIATAVLKEVNLGRK